MDFEVADLCDNNRDKTLQVLISKFKNFGGLKKCAGEIVTLKLHKSNWELLRILREEDGKNRILVVDNEEYFYGVVGDKLMALAKKNNWQAIILNGYVRDIQYTKNIEVGLYALGSCPLRNFEKTEFERGVKLHFGGVVFCNGNYLYADTDGIIVSEKILE